MKAALIALLALFSFASSAYAQKQKTILGDAFTGDVVSSNETTREITITYTNKDTNKTDTFVGVLKQGYLVRLRDGTQRELQMAEIKPGVRVTVLYKEKSQNVGGQKVKFSQIISLQFLGRDNYTSLRETLGVAPSLPVTLTPSDELPATNPLKLYVAIHEPYVKERLLKWVAQWNKEQAAKYGSIEIVSDLDHSDVAASFFWGYEDSITMLPILAGAGGDDLHEFYQATLHLVTKDNEGVKILWLKKTVESRKKIEDVQGQIEREIEKRLKARGKK